MTPVFRSPIAASLVLTIVAFGLASCDDGTDADAVSGGEPAAASPVDLEGQPVAPIAARRPTLLLFMRTDCPIANRYAPEIRRIHEEFASQGVAVFLVYVDPAETAAAIKKHLAEYELPGTPLRDPNHVLVLRTEATITPEAALFDTQEKLRYRGRIDDRFVDFGKTRPAATRHDLRDALAGLLNGSLAEELVTTTAVGCYIGDLTPDAGN